MHLLSLLLSLVLLVHQTQGYEILSENSEATEQECLNLLGSDSFDPSGLNAKYVGFAMKRGFWKCAKELSNMANAMEIDVRSVFDMESRTIAKEIKEIKAAIESTLPVANILPAFQWAQSTTEIFINVKFAHKLDAPATLNVEAEIVNISDTHLVLKATDGRKVFNLNIEFLRKVVPAESSWSMASVGRMTITLKKQSGPDNWVRLTKSKKKPNNIHFWWELHEKHAKELEALADSEDENGDPIVKPPPPAASPEADVVIADTAAGAGGDTEAAASTGAGAAATGAGASTEAGASTGAGAAGAGDGAGDGDDSDVSSDPGATATDHTVPSSSTESTEEPSKITKEKKKKTKKIKKPKDTKPSLDDQVRELEKAGKEQKKEVDRRARAEKEVINKETEEKITELRRNFYKTPPSDQDKVLPGGGAEESASAGAGAGDEARDDQDESKNEL